MIGKQTHYRSTDRRVSDANRKLKSGSPSTSDCSSSDCDAPDHSSRGPFYACSSINTLQREPATRPATRYKLKVELCKNFSLHKSCPYELNCRFAHGVEELL